MEECLKNLATLLKVTLLHGCFSRFLKCTNGAKQGKASHIEHYNVSMVGFEQVNVGGEYTFSC